MKFPLIEPLRHNGQRHKAGGTIELDPQTDIAEILRLVMLGVIRDVRPTAQESQGNGKQRNDAGSGDAGAPGDGESGQGVQDNQGGAATADAVAQAAGDAGASAVASTDGTGPTQGEQPGAAKDEPGTPKPKAPVKSAAKKAAAKAASKVKAV